MSHLPELIRVRVTSRKSPLASLVVLTRIVMHELNDYWGIFGVTDDTGELVITREQLTQNAATTRDYNIEEYADLETHMAGLIEVRVLDEAGIVRALEAADELTDYPYLPGHREMLQHGRDTLIRLGRLLMEVEVTAVGGDCEVRAQPPL